MRHYDRKHPGTSAKVTLKDHETCNGYSIDFKCLANLWNVSKDGFHICSSQTLNEARLAVYSITEEGA